MPQRTDTVRRFEDEVFFGLQRRVALFGWMAALALLIALCAVGAMVVMLPLKEIRPYVVMVDRQTGESEMVVSTRPADLAETEAVRQAELVRYVTERETYDVADNRERIPRVLATSEGQAADTLRALHQNASGPLKEPEVMPETPLPGAISHDQDVDGVETKKATGAVAVEPAPFAPAPEAAPSAEKSVQELNKIKKGQGGLKGAVSAHLQKAEPGPERQALDAPHPGSGRFAVEIDDATVGGAAPAFAAEASV